MMQKPTPRPRRPRRKLATFTVKVAGVFVVRAQAADAKVARDKVMKSLVVGGTPSMTLDDSLVTVGTIGVQPATIRRSRPVQVFNEDTTPDAAEVLAYLISCDPEPPYIELKKVAKDLQKVLDHLSHLAAHGQDPLLQLAGNDVAEAVRRMSSARTKLVQRTQIRMQDGYTPGQRSAA